jgi:serine protease
MFLRKIILVCSLVLLIVIIVPNVSSARSLEHSIRADDASISIENERPPRPLRPERDAPQFSEDEILVKMKGSNRPIRVRNEEQKNISDFVREYANQEDVEYAEPNYIAYALATPNDPFYPNQWNFDNAQYGGVHAGSAWDIGQGQGVIVAVIDTGVAYENYGTGLQAYYQAPDLAGTTFVQGYDFVNRDTHPNDDEGHGTHVAGTIAQTTDNVLGTAGLAYKASIMPLKVLNQNGSGTYADITEAIRYAADNGAQVINMSLGGSQSSIALADAITYAYGKGVTIVAASGNNGGNVVSYPAAYPEVISVGATRYDETRAPYSNYGATLDIVAPGGDTTVDQNNDGYVDGILQQTFGTSRSAFNYYFYQGTSMATPHVAAAAALVIGKGTALTPDAVRNVLQSTADDLGVAGRDNTYGYGLLNVASALGATATVTPPVVPPPPANVTVFSDSFENGFGKWVQDSQRDWAISTQRATNGSRSVEVDGSSNNSSITATVDLQGKTNATISYSWFIESSLDAGEYLAFDVSTNGGTTWQNLASLNGNQDPENIWQSKQHSLSNISSLKLKLRGTMSQSTEDANVDDVLVTAW